MITPINSSSSKKNTIIKSSALAATGVAAGAGTAYFLQKRAIKTAEAAKQAAANKNFFQKAIDKTLSAIGWVFSKTKNLLVTAKDKYNANMKEIGNSGKISKAGIAKAAIITGLALPAIYLIKQTIANSKQKQEIEPESEM